MENIEDNDKEDIKAAFILMEMKSRHKGLNRLGNRDSSAESGVECGYQNETAADSVEQCGATETQQRCGTAQPDQRRGTTEPAMVTIGPGETLVPADTMRQVDSLRSYPKATRKLLKAVFLRETLAISSMTGKGSNAHPHKAPKVQLDPDKVADIVLFVSQTWSVPKSLVKICITRKCADEAKLLKTRHRKSDTVGL